MGWSRHLTLVMLALAFLTSIALAARTPSPTQEAPEPSPAEAVLSCDLCPLSVPQARRVLARLLFSPAKSFGLVLAWSAWRRRHQHVARFFQTRHRLKAG